MAAQITSGDLILNADLTDIPSNNTSTAPDSSLKTQRNALIGTTAAFAVLMLAAAILALLWRRRLKKEEQDNQIKERDRQRLKQERDMLEQEKMRVTNEKQRIERAIAGLSGPIRREAEAAIRNLGSNA